MDLYFVLLSLIRTFAPKTTTMKKTLLSFWLLIMVASVSAQTIVKGDMNGDGELTVTDAVKVVNVILGNAPKQAIDLDDTYRVDNTLVVGTWKPKGMTAARTTLHRSHISTMTITAPHTRSIITMEAFGLCVSPHL